MPSDTNGFRSLVEQIQLRDRDTVPPRETARPRSPRGATTASPSAGDQTKTSSAKPERPGLLARRWL